MRRKGLLPVSIGTNGGENDGNNVIGKSSSSVDDLGSISNARQTTRTASQSISRLLFAEHQITSKGISERSAQSKGKLSDPSCVPQA